MRNEIHPGEILDLLRQRIAGFDPTGSVNEVGRIIQAGDGIARVWGLDQAIIGELIEVELPHGETVDGMVMNLEEENVGIVLFSNFEDVKEGHLVKRTGRVAEVPAGEAMLGRVVDPLGNPIDGGGAIESAERQRVEVKGPGILERQNVQQPLQTGIKAIDAMIPIGRGQRELIIGDRRTGKTAIALDTIINQQQANDGETVYCFYVAVGQKRSSVVQLVERLRRHNALSYTTVIAATASDPAALQYLAPYAGCAMAEYFRDHGKHALIIFDDLTKHAQAYRELSLLMRRSPGREAYPGDIFYLHSRLLERAAKMSEECGGGSLTALPIVETQEGDVSAYIPTNVISITDGQIFLETNLFNSGLRPAVNVGISVSRVGGDAQVKAMKQTAGSLRIDLAQFRELAAFMQFSSDLDEATRKQLDRGERLMELLKQPQYEPIDIYKQIIILRAGITGRLDRYPTEKLKAYEAELMTFLDTVGGPFLSKLKERGAFDEELEEELNKLFSEFEEIFKHEQAQAGIDSGYTAKMAMALSHRTSGFNRDMLQLVERVTARELASPSLEEELEGIISGKDSVDKDQFDHLVEVCPVLDYPEGNRDEIFRSAIRHMRCASNDSERKKFFEGLIKRETAGSTALTPFLAVPHIVLDGKGIFEMVIVRCRRGVEMSEDAPAVHALFFLMGTMDKRHFHLVALSAIAQIIQQPNFERDWLSAKSTTDMRNLIRFGKRRRENPKPPQS